MDFKKVYHISLLTQDGFIKIVFSPNKLFLPKNILENFKNQEPCRIRNKVIFENNNNFFTASVFFSLCFDVDFLGHVVYYLK